MRVYTPSSAVSVQLSAGTNDPTCTRMGAHAQRRP